MHPDKEIAAAQSNKSQALALARLLRDWMEDESGYDEKAWPRLKQAMEANRLSDRRRFDE